MVWSLRRRLSAFGMFSSTTARGGVLMALTLGSLPPTAVRTTLRPPSSRTRRRVMNRLMRPMARMMMNRIHASAAARPKLNSPQPMLYRYSVIVSHCWAAPPSPVLSNMRGSSKICRPPMVEVMIDEDEGRPKRRERDAARTGGRRRAVDGRRLVVLARHRLHGGEEDEGVVARSSGSSPSSRSRCGSRTGPCATGSAFRPRSARTLLTRPWLSPNMLLKISATATGAMTIGQQHAHAPEGLGADVAVEHRGDEDRRG